MDLSQILPLMMMMNGNKNPAPAGGAEGGGQSAPPAMNYEEIIRNMNKNGGSPMDILQGMPGMGGMNPEMLRIFQMFTEVNNNRNKPGGIPQDMLFDLIGGSNPQFRQIKSMMEMMRNMNAPKDAAPPAEGQSVQTAGAPEKNPNINDLNPIRTIAPDAVYRSMRDYMNNKAADK